MKKCIYTGLGLVCAYAACGQIDSKVIHNYNEIGVGYQYLHSDDVDGHGFIARASTDLNNLLLGISGGYTWIDDFDAETWGVAGSVGYAIRLMENHINIIPRVGVGYSEATVDFGPFGSDTEGFASIQPGITVSYAINNQISLNASYSYLRDIDEDFDIEDHGFGVGARFALNESWGLDVGVGFDDEEGFTGIGGMISWHY